MNLSHRIGPPQSIRLITTGLSPTLSEGGETFLFLGAWCLTPSVSKSSVGTGYKLVEYHWDCRKKLSKDYEELLKLHEVVLTSLKCWLNEVHTVNYSDRFWRLVIGPWLGYFLPVLYDRWSIVEGARRSYRFDCVKLHLWKSSDFIARDTFDFSSMCTTDEWNDYVFGEVIKELFPKSMIHTDATIMKFNKSNIYSNNRVNRSIRGIFFSAINFILKKIYRDDEIFMLSTYLGPTAELLFNFKLKQTPKVWTPVLPHPSPIDPKLRSGELSIPALPGSVFSTRFMSFLSRFLLNSLPSIFVEGFKYAERKALSLPWPRNPRVIFTSSSFYSDEIFKIWAALKVSGGSRLVIGQHGGNFGAARWNFFEDHKIAIADKFLTWGWSRKDCNNVVPVGNLKLFSKRFARPTSNGVALLIGMTLPRYSYHMFSSPISAGQLNKYYRDQFDFVAALPTRIKDQILVRLHQHDRELDQRGRWTEFDENIALDAGVSAIETLYKSSRIVISTYNASSYLETMAMNFPTIIFWDSRYWELRDEAAVYFKLLREVGVLHHNSVDAAKFLAEVWDDIEAWWYTPKVQNAREVFCDNFSFTPRSPFAQLAKVLQCSP